ncbi:hypothetical protein GUITHDRAFT_134046 [Guillardia theta CCMP2712]|uniref:EF-hand domain-containing protein n=2 Tax=Guillardia theta TaxID=55529 RepID=L1JVN3_GUITC|nr:hypothetical protein GUITHDRAFT_134046 [Guillardia theta CCMP2712]EKX52364.1 hypothetical protein GUITHDRAFT_134046 [Guillardia theta CCMP2712]|eukprot:XP_005839344.1 hypothetical protein GUITHDRAFT_134046 [Guillardia theta CCMP2712]
MSEPRTDGATRRKTWDRTGQAVNIKDTDVKSDSLAGKGVDPSYREYLAVLQEKNRILRELRKKEEKKKEALAQRERGFEVNFLGANEERIRKKQENDKGGGALRKDQRSNVRQRSAWQKGSIQIQTMRGSVIRLAPPSMEQTRESMQWLVSEEGRTWLETEQGQDWLQTEPDEDKDGRAEGSLVRDSLRILAATLKLFQFLDRDGDGFIEALDWVEVLHDIDTSEELSLHTVSEFQSADSDEDLYSEDVDRGDMMEEEGENADVEEEQYEDDFASDDDAVNIFSQGSDGESKGELPHARVKNEDEISEESFEDDEESLEKTIEEIESDGSLHDEFEAAVDEAEKVWSQPSSTKTMSAQESNARIIRSALPPMSSASSSSLLPRRATSARDVKEGAESSSSANAVNKDKKELDAILAALARENEEVASTPKASQVEQEFAKDNFIGISKSQDNTGAATGSSEKKLFQREVVATTERSPDPMKAVSSVLAKETRQIPAVALDSGDAKYKSGLSPPPSSSQHQLAQEDDEKLKHDNELVVHVLSNWGNKKVVGLTEIELFDETGSKVRIANAQVSTFGFKSSTDRSNRLINGCKLTTNDADMWSAYLSEEGEGGQIVFVLPAQVCIGAVRLWNYNKSMLDSDKGVSITSDFSTTVELIDGIKLPVVTFEEETKLVVQPVQDVRLRDVEEGEPIWLTGKDSKQSSSDQLLPSLPSADVMGEIPLLVMRDEMISSAIRDEMR